MSKSDDPTIGRLVADASRDLSALVQSEVKLAKNELKLQRQGRWRRRGPARGRWVLGRHRLVLRRSPGARPRSGLRSRRRSSSSPASTSSLTILVFVGIACSRRSRPQSARSPPPRRSRPPSRAAELTLGRTRPAMRDPRSGDGRRWRRRPARMTSHASRESAARSTRGASAGSGRTRTVASVWSRHASGVDRLRSTATADRRAERQAGAEPAMAVHVRRATSAARPGATMAADDSRRSARRVDSWVAVDNISRSATASSTDQPARGQSVHLHDGGRHAHEQSQLRQRDLRPIRPGVRSLGHPRDGSPRSPFRDRMVRSG